MQVHNYRTRAIISRGLYIFYPIFEDQFFVFKDVFMKILTLCMASIQERIIMARIRYLISDLYHGFFFVISGWHKTKSEK